MSSVAVLTQESFAEHRSGLVPPQIKGDCALPAPAPGLEPRSAGPRVGVGRRALSHGQPGPGWGSGAGPRLRLPSEEESDPPTYKDAFPPLPEKAACLEGAPEPAGAWGNKIRPIKASVITQVFHVPLEERKYKDMHQFGEGEQAKICLEIMQRTGAHLELSLAKDQGLSIMVSGKLDAVMKARKDIVARLQTQASATVAIPKEHHRFVIGKNGEKLQDLELKTATKIQIPRPDDASNQIRITGTKEGIEKARHEVLLISAEQDKRAVERLEVEKAFHPFIAGPYNRLVGEIMQETGTRISIPPPSVSRTEIVLTGEKEQLAQAVARIKKIYEEKKKKTTTIAVEVKKSQHKYVIGPKGNSLQEILERTGVSVEIPPSDSTSETVILRGEPEKLGQALTEVYAKANSFTVSSVSAPSWLHRFIIGKKGQNLAKITQQMPKVHVEFTEGEDRITLEGPTEDVAVAQEQIEAMVRDLVSRMDYVEINIDHKFHRHLIGKSGANINRIKEQYKVSVRIPPDSEKSSLVRIEGDPQGVQQAKQELLELASRMENERTKDLVIEQRFHRTIIGQKGERIREIRDKFPEVIINFPDPAQKSDIVQLRGPKNEVEKCTKYMHKMVADLVENSYSISVPIFKQFHKNIIGKGGANIKKIREESNTKIDLPAENSNSETIVITGKRANCEAARSRILSIQKDLANIAEVEVSIPARLHNSLIGTKGRLIRAIMEECGGVHIHFPVEGSGSDTVVIRGPAADVEKARKQLLHLAEEKQTKSFTVDIRAKPEYHKFLIGKGGGTIRRVRDSTGARVIFPSAEDKEQDLITVVGKEEAVREAQRELEALIQSLDNVVEDYMLVDPKHHRHFVIRRGQVLREIADEYGGVMVSFPRSGTQSDRVTLKGAKDCVEAAKKRIQEIIEDLVGAARPQGPVPPDPLRPHPPRLRPARGLTPPPAAQEAQVTVECAIPQKFHRSVMGPKGSRIQQITRDFNVQIKFPDREENPGGSTPCPGGSGKRRAHSCPALLHSLVPLWGGLTRAPVGCVPWCRAAAEPRLQAGGSVGRDPICVPPGLAGRGGCRAPSALHRAASRGRVWTRPRRAPVPGWPRAGPGLRPRPPSSATWLLCGLGAGLPERELGRVLPRPGGGSEQDARAVSGGHSAAAQSSLCPVPSTEPAVQENGDDAGSGRDAREAEPGSPRRCDIVTISGRKEKCEAAREALEALVPVTVEVEVPFDLHRYVIGQKGSGIRKMMDEFEVSIHVPAPELQSDVVAITGLAAHLDRAKAGLLERVKELQAEQEDRALRSFKLSVSVDPKYHPKIIGRKGAVITQIRLEHDVNIQFPDKDDGTQPQDQITITGYEKNTEAARDAILRIVGELEQMVSEDVSLDHRVHARIIGARGKAIRKIMDEFKVDIRFPQSGAPDPNCVTVTGLPANVEEAIDHILNLEEEYVRGGRGGARAGAGQGWGRACVPADPAPTQLADVVDSEALQVYMKPPAHEESKAPSRGFVVRDAPWTAHGGDKVGPVGHGAGAAGVGGTALLRLCVPPQAPDMSSSEEFPSFGAQVAPKTLPWGPKR
ncbi:Vigilin [Galemys pyrenaicus]|uniref:Vigilin n=4 Tax=Boreoeutheria TaxID=1437010 RepID=A0A8J6A0C9_GALPY|nr:Vigilin [Galemys pyrenaicus]